MSSLLLIFSTVIMYKSIAIAKKGLIKGVWESIEFVGRAVGWVIGIIILIVSLISIIFI